MSEYAGIIIGVTVCVVAFVIFVCWLLDKRRPEDFYEPYGDATDTPNVIHMCKRANHRRGK